MTGTTTSTSHGWRHMERYAYVERPYEDVWLWLAAHLSSLGDPLPDGGHSFELRIWPGGKEVSRPVRLHVGGLVASDGCARASLGWVDATRPHLFPQLEAVLEITPVPNEVRPFTQLGVLARYRPPFGPLGALGDRLVGAEVTDATLTTFLDELARVVADHTVPPTLQPIGLHGAGHADDNSDDIQRMFATVDGLDVRPGGATGACQAMLAVPGVVNVSLDPWNGLVAVDHAATCPPHLIIAALERTPTGADPT